LAFDERDQSKRSDDWPPTVLMLQIGEERVKQDRRLSGR
jgi:hypothetical protein